MKPGPIPVCMKPLLQAVFLCLIMVMLDSVTVFSVLASVSLGSMSVFRVIHLVQKKDDYVLSSNVRYDILIRCAFFLFTGLFLLANYFFYHADQINLLLGGVSTAISLIALIVFPLIMVKDSPDKDE